MKWYSSFLLRCWHLDDEGRRLEIEHIQSGTRTRVDSIAAAIAWISTQGTSTEDDGIRQPHHPAETRHDRQQD